MGTRPCSAPDGPRSLNLFLFTGDGNAIAAPAAEGQRLRPSKLGLGAQTGHGASDVEDPDPQGPVTGL